MDVLESTTQSFIVKVWVEESADGTSQGVWHGHITHVPSRKRQYLKNLDEIKDFIAPHLEEMGVKLDRGWRIARWFKRPWVQG
jgi:hypothetical protein